MGRDARREWCEGHSNLKCKRGCGATWVQYNLPVQTNGRPRTAYTQIDAIPWRWLEQFYSWKGSRENRLWTVPLVALLYLTHYLLAPLPLLFAYVLVKNVAAKVLSLTRTWKTLNLTNLNSHDCLPY